jgi:hypothetical protein
MRNNKRIIVLAKVFLFKVRAVVTMSNKMIGCYIKNNEHHRVVVTKLCREKRR